MPIDWLFFLSEGKKLVNNFKKFLVFLIDDINSDIEIFLPYKLGIHFKSSFAIVKHLSYYVIIRQFARGMQS